MKKLVAATAGFCIINISLAGAAHAVNWSPQAYQAIYEETSAGGVATRVYAYDGKGHARNEVTRNGRTDVSILDMPNQKMTMLLPDGHTAMVMTLSAEQAQTIGSEMQANITDKVSLGKKLIEGHLCQGSSYKLGNIAVELWTGDDISGCRVLSKTNSPYGQTTVRLKSYTAGAPAASAFVVPANYKIAPSFSSLIGKQAAK